MRIIEIAGRAAVDSAEWRLGASEEVLFQPEGTATAAALLRDGSVAVLDGSDHRVRVYRDDGTLAASYGGEGSGPGEFDEPVSLTPYRTDSLAVMDAGLRRVLVFTEDGGFARSVQIRLPVQRVGLVGTLSDGSFVLSGWSFGAGEKRLWRQPIVIVRLDADGLQVDTLSVLEGEEFYRIEFGGGPVFGLRPYGRKTVAAAGGDGVAINAGETCELQLYRGDDSKLARLRPPCRQRSVTAEARERWAAAHVERVAKAPNGAYATALYRSPRIPYPRLAPPYDRLLVDECGVVWVGAYGLPGDTVKEWSLFSTGGVRLTTLATPSNAELQQASENRVLAIRSDALGVNRVVAYPLSRPRCVYPAP